MSKIKTIKLPITLDVIKTLKAGDILELEGVIYTGRDAAHKRLVELIERQEELPICLKNSAIYYVGPTPAKPGRVIGSCGPTSSYRMDPYTEPLLKEGLKVMIGKGSRSEDYKKLLQKYDAVYLSAIGGAAASISESVDKCELICYEDLGAEAIYKLKVNHFFCVVTYDSFGNDLFEDGIKEYKIER